MSNMQQVIEDIGLADNSKARGLTADELGLIGRARDAYLSLSPISCTACKYCAPCHNGVDIPRVFDLYNEAMMYNDAMSPRWAYAHPNFKEHRADKCTKCEECLEKCPQKLPIPDLLEKAHEFLTRK